MNWFWKVLIALLMVFVIVQLVGYIVEKNHQEDLKEKGEIFWSCVDECDFNFNYANNRSLNDSYQDCTKDCWKRQFEGVRR